jgi:hypothetical protein
MDGWTVSVEVLNGQDQKAMTALASLLSQHDSGATDRDELARQVVVSVGEKFPARIDVDCEPDGAGNPRFRASVWSTDTVLPKWPERPQVTVIRSTSPTLSEALRELL